MDPLAAWKSIVEDPQKKKAYCEARGMGGLVRTSWNTALKLSLLPTSTRLTSTVLIESPVSHRFQATLWSPTVQVLGICA